jgi:cytoskeletal protein CcmA (bactofilin family)
MVVHLIDGVKPELAAISRGGRTPELAYHAGRGCAGMDERRKSAWISGSIVVRGDVVADEDLVIDGQIHGTIKLGDHSLTIGPGAIVTANLVAKTVTISGTVKGDVIGNAKVEMKSTAKVEGDIRAPKFVIEDGATLSGKVDTGDGK